jgi:hypothetical protein
MKTLHRVILTFAILYAFFLIAPALLSSQFAPYPLLKNGDILDLFTPLVLLPLYWWMLEHGGTGEATARERFVFVVLAAAWAMGQGMHLGANAVGHLLGDLRATDAYTLNYFLDEDLSHYLWHAASIGLIVLLLVRQTRAPFADERSSFVTEGIAALLYGLTYFIVTIEAGTLPLGLPFAIALAVFGFLRRAQLRQQPLAAFFVFAMLVALILFTGWGLYWRGFPEFSQVGIIK